MSTPSRGELPIIQATMDLIQWFVPLLNRLPRDHRFALGDRLVQGLYDLLEGLVVARYATAKLERLEPLNARLDLLRLQIRLLHNFQLIDDRRYEHVARLVEEVGRQLGGWISQQRRQGQTTAPARCKCKEIGSSARAQERLRAGHSYLDRTGDGIACKALRKG